MRTCHCPICDGPPVVLGQLGNLLWMRCRNCGMEYSLKQLARKALKIGPKNVRRVSSQPLCERCGSGPCCCKETY